MSERARAKAGVRFSFLFLSLFSLLPTRLRAARIVGVAWRVLLDDDASTPSAPDFPLAASSGDVEIGADDEEAEAARATARRAGGLQGEDEAAAKCRRRRRRSRRRWKRHRQLRKRKRERTSHLAFPLLFSSTWDALVGSVVGSGYWRQSPSERARQRESESREKSNVEDEK